METEVHQEYDVSTVGGGPTVATTREEIAALARAIREGGDPALASKREVSPEEWDALVRGLEVEQLSTEVEGAEQSPAQRAKA
eukprot:scaffold31974_cov62-Cyclotella_meneghiniana.AAC.2